jgi:nucleoside-diphosphate-sugar epimerase
MALKVRSLTTVQVTAEEAIAKKDTVLGYNVSKTSAESAAWEFMKSESPCFDLAVINPDIITGPMIHPISGPKSINETNHFAIASFIDGTHQQVEGVTFPFYHFVSSTRLWLSSDLIIITGGRPRCRSKPC